MEKKIFQTFEMPGSCSLKFKVNRFFLQIQNYETKLLQI